MLGPAANGHNEPPPNPSRSAGRKSARDVAKLQDVKNARKRANGFPGGMAGADAEAEADSPKESLGTRPRAAQAAAVPTPDSDLSAAEDLSNFPSLHKRARRGSPAVGRVPSPAPRRGVLTPPDSVTEDTSAMTPQKPAAAAATEPLSSDLSSSPEEMLKKIAPASFYSVSAPPPLQPAFIPAAEEEPEMPQEQEQPAKNSVSEPIPRRPPRKNETELLLNDAMSDGRPGIPDTLDLDGRRKRRAGSVRSVTSSVGRLDEDKKPAKKTRVAKLVKEPAEDDGQSLASASLSEAEQPSRKRKRGSTPALSKQQANGGSLEKLSRTASSVPGELPPASESQSQSPPADLVAESESAAAAAALPKHPGWEYVPVYPKLPPAPTDFNDPYYSFLPPDLITTAASINDEFKSLETTIRSFHTEFKDLQLLAVDLESQFLESDPRGFPEFADREDAAEAKYRQRTLYNEGKISLEMERAGRVFEAKRKAAEDGYRESVRRARNGVFEEAARGRVWITVAARQEAEESGYRDAVDLGLETGEWSLYFGGKSFAFGKKLTVFVVLFLADPALVQLLMPEGIPEEFLDYEVASDAEVEVEVEASSLAEKKQDADAAADAPADKTELARATATTTTEAVEAAEATDTITKPKPKSRETTPVPASSSTAQVKEPGTASTTTEPPQQTTPSTTSDLLPKPQPQPVLNRLLAPPHPGFSWSSFTTPSASPARTVTSPSKTPRFKRKFKIPPLVRFSEEWEYPWGGLLRGLEGELERVGKVVLVDGDGEIVNEEEEVEEEEEEEEEEMMDEEGKEEVVGMDGCSSGDELEADLALVLGTANNKNKQHAPLLPYSEPSLVSTPQRAPQPQLWKSPYTTPTGSPAQAQSQQSDKPISWPSPPRLLLPASPPQYLGPNLYLNSPYHPHPPPPPPPPGGYQYNYPQQQRPQQPWSPQHQHPAQSNSGSPTKINGRSRSPSAGLGSPHNANGNVNVNGNGVPRTV